MDDPGDRANMSVRGTQHVEEGDDEVADDDGNMCCTARIFNRIGYVDDRRLAASPLPKRDVCCRTEDFKARSLFIIAHAEKYWYTASRPSRVWRQFPRLLQQGKPWVRAVSCMAGIWEPLSGRYTVSNGSVRNGIATPVPREMIVV